MLILTMKLIEPTPTSLSGRMMKCQLSPTAWMIRILSVKTNMPDQSLRLSNHSDDFKLDQKAQMEA